MELRILHPPSCRIRKEYGKVRGAFSSSFSSSSGGETTTKKAEEERLILRCHVTEADPIENITFFWFHDGLLLQGVGAGGVLALPGEAEGDYACEAQNSIGAGRRCAVKVSPRPVAALVAETGYSTYLLFGGAAVVCAAVGFVLAAMLCRRMAFGKYDLPPASAAAYTVNRSGNNGVSGGNGGDGGRSGNLHQHQGILKSSGSNGQVNHIVQEDGLYVSGAASPPHMSSSSSLCRNGGGGGGGGVGVGPPSYHHHFGNGVTRVKRVTLNEGRTSIEESLEEEEEEEVPRRCEDVDAVMNELMMGEEEEMMYPPPPPPPARHMAVGGRHAVRRAPRELWLV